MSNKKELSSEWHTLFSEVVEEKKTLVDKEKSLYKIVPKHTKYRIFIDSFREIKKGLHIVFDELKNAKKHDTLEIVINSRGGLVSEGMQFFNIIEEKFYNRTVAYLDNKGYSMGALLFCMASKRVIYPYSDLMFHNYSGMAMGKGGEIKAGIKHRDKLLREFFYDIIVKQGFLTKVEFEKMLIGQDYWMNAKELCKRGIATHIIVNGKELTAKEYLKMLKKEKKKRK
jgi:ATP-dependent protease ClpP protease subunit